MSLHRVFPTCLALLALGCGDDMAAPVAAAGGASSAAAGMGQSGGSDQVAPPAGTPALGGGDQGQLFGADARVPLAPAGPETGGSAGGSSAPGNPLGDGNVATMTMRGPIGGTAVFTQTGADVSVVVALTSCPDGAHHFRIHDGYACDNPATQGMLWGARGSDIGDPNGIVCSAGQGSLTYTRPGTDPTKNWTVADHNLDTDVTAHVVMVLDAVSPDTNPSCGNFF